MSSFLELLGRIGRADANVAVLGQGYVGLTLACAVAEAGHTVTGIDVDAERVRALDERPDAVPGVDPATVTRAIATGRLRFTTDVSAVGDAQIVAICVPTPLLDGAPDLRFVERAARDAAACLRPGTLVILESTTYPGTTETVVRPILESGGLRSGTDFLLAYSPERVDPGNREHGMRSTPRLVGGDTPEAATAAASFYGAFVDKVLPVSSTARRGDREAAGEHVPPREHRADQRVRRAGLRAGDRRVGGDRRRGDEAVRLHAVLPRPRHRWALHPAGPHVPVLGGASADRQALRGARGRAGRERADADLRRHPRGRDPERRRTAGALQPHPGARA